MRKALLTKIRLGFIDGTLTLSSPLVSTLSTIQAWIRCDNMVGTWLTNSVSPKIRASIVYEDTALEIWTKLRGIFSQKNGPRIFNLQKQIAKLHQGEVSITDVFTQLKMLWDQLQSYSPFPSCAYGKCVYNVNKRLTELQVRKSVMKFLIGVNDSFSQVRTQVLLMDPLSSLNKLYALLVQEEVQRTMTNGANTRVESTVLAAKSQNFSSESTTNLNNKEKDRSLCTHCGKLGHTIDKCYKLHGFSPGFKFKNKPSMAHQVSSGQISESLPFASPLHNHSTFTPDQYQQLLVLIGASNSSFAATSQAKKVPMANVASSSNIAMASIDFSHSVFSAQVVNKRAYGRHTWVLDTSATYHFICSVDLLTTITATM